MLLRQSLLTAHELGHVMGFQHNFSSSLDNFASVMEYPTPRVKVTAGKLDLSDAFQRAIGPYDEMTARYAYTDFPAGKERDGLEAVIREMRAKGLHYVPETDPRWTWYDDRATPAEYLRETMAARAIMLASYGPNVLRARRADRCAARHAAVDDLPPSPLGDRVGPALRRRDVPRVHRQGRHGAHQRRSSRRRRSARCSAC